MGFNSVFKGLILDRVHVSDAYVSTGLMSTLYINVLVFFEVKWDLRCFLRRNGITLFIYLYIFNIRRFMITCYFIQISVDAMLQLIL